MTDATDELDGLRNEIDRIDAEIADLVAERVDRAEQVAAVKSRAGLSLVDETREEDVKSHYAELFQQRELGTESGRDLAEFLIETSLVRERSIAGDSRDS